MTPAVPLLLTVVCFYQEVNKNLCVRCALCGESYFFSFAQSCSSASRVKCDSLTPVLYWQMSENT